MENENKESKVGTADKKREGSVKVAKKGLNKALIITAIVLTVIAIAIIIFAIVNKLNSNVYNNVYIGGIEVSGKTETELAQIVKEINEQFKKKNITIKYDNKTIMEFSPASIDMTLDEEATIEKVMGFGREQNIVSNNIEILKAMFKKHQIEPIYTYAEAKLINVAAEITTGIDGRVKDDSFTLDEENYTLIITKGTSGKDIVVTEFKEDILKVLKSDNITEYTLQLENRAPMALDVDVVYAKVSKDAKDAYVDETVKPVVYHKHEMGITFDKEDLRTVLAKKENQAEGKIIKFKLTTMKPKVTIQDITKDIYDDKLASYVSSYVNSDSNRASNVVLGASMLNGTVVMPGETFSFNEVMGDCGLSSRGFKPAAVFKAGKVVQEVGGGICQISSTLYCAVLYANLDIVSRSNHALPVGYVPVSLDATVYYPYLDFKFKNTREYPIKIVATTTSSRKLTIAIYGTKEDKEYDVELTSWVTESVPSKVEKQNDSSLAKGKTKVIQAGSAGYKSVAYKTVKYKGKVISKEMLSKDSYGSTPKIIAVGTKVVSSNKDKDKDKTSTTNKNNNTNTNTNNNNNNQTPPSVTPETNTGNNGTTDTTTGTTQPETGNTTGGQTTNP